MAVQPFDLNTLITGGYKAPFPTVAAPKAAPAPQVQNNPGNGGAVYWVGADGNVWLKGSSGVQNVGKPSNLQAGGFDAARLSAQATRINDPNPPKAAAPGNPTGASAPVLPDKSNDIAFLNSNLAGADSQNSVGLAKVAQALANIIGGYDTEAGQNQTAYQGNSDNNQNAYQKNKASALVGAAQGRKGLFGTLASLGALNGSGIDLANKAVVTGANQDLSGAADNYATNQTGFDAALQKFKDEDAARRKDAQTAADDAKTTVQYNTAKTKQDIYRGIANDYEAEGNHGAAADYTGRASALFPEIANYSIPSTNLAKTPAAFNLPSLSSYLANAGGTQVSSTPSTNGGASGVNGLPGLIASNKRKVTA